jgi:hypothetical protein
VTVTAAANSGAQRTATVTISGGGITRTVSVTQSGETQDVVVEPGNPTEGGSDYLILRLGIPTDDPFSGTFLVIFPPGMALDLTGTVLFGSLADRYDLLVTQVSANTWSVEIRQNVSPRSASSGTYRDIVRIAYTVDESVAEGTYEIVISDLEIILLNDNTVIREDEIRVEVTAGSGANGNAPLESSEEILYYNGVLSVRTPVSEPVTVYSLSGVPVFTAKKEAGLATFRLNSLPTGVYIVRGSSWVRKIIIQKM